MTKRKDGMFTGRARRSMEKPRTSFGYLTIPDSVNVFKPEGDTEIIFDIVPYIVSDKNHMDGKKYAEDAVAGNPWWKRPLKVHRGVGPDQVSIICPTTVGAKCPICEYFTKRRRAGDDWEDIRDYLPSNRTLYAIIPTDVRDCEVDYTEGEIHIFEQPDHYFGKALDAALDKDITMENFADPEQGASVRVYFRVGKVGKYEFAEAVKVDFMDRDEQYSDEIAEESPDLDAMMKILPYKEIEALFLGMEGMDDEDLDNQELEEEPSKRTRKTTRASSTKERSSRRSTAKERTTRKPKEEEPAEEEKPARRTRSARKPKEECPFDHEFGADNDEFEDCDKCKVWESCRDAKGSE